MEMNEFVAGVRKITEVVHPIAYRINDRKGDLEGQKHTDEGMDNLLPRLIRDLEVLEDEVQTMLKIAQKLKTIKTTPPEE